MDRLRAFDRRVTRWMADRAVTFLRISVGIVFVWFGVPKFFPGVSPADQLATDTISALTFGLLQPSFSRVALAILETTIGLGLITRRFMRLTLLMLFGQMIGTLTPLFLFPDLTWVRFPLVPTLEGQYIIKNLVLVSAGVAIGATVRGGGMLDNPDAFDVARAVVEPQS